MLKTLTYATTCKKRKFRSVWRHDVKFYVSTCDDSSAKFGDIGGGLVAVSGSVRVMLGGQSVSPARGSWACGSHGETTATRKLPLGGVLHVLGQLQVPRRVLL